MANIPEKWNKDKVQDSPFNFPSTHLLTPIFQQFYDGRELNTGFQGPEGKGKL